MLTRLPYTLLWIFALPLVLLRLLWRARRQPAYLRHVGERFGRYRMRAPVGVIWVHAVSVGETRAAEPLVRALLAQWPEHSVLITHMTPTGRDTSKALFRDEPRVLRAYLPYDLGCFAHAFLRHFRPLFGVIMETELWPNLLAACKRRRVPVMLANARLSERSARRYARLPVLTALTLKALGAIGAQTAADAARLTQLGARRVTVTGNIKFDIVPPQPMLALGAMMRAHIGARPVGAGGKHARGARRPCCSTPSPATRRTMPCCCWCRAIRSASMKARRSPARADWRCSAAAPTWRSPPTPACCLATRWVRCSPTTPPPMSRCSVAAGCPSADRT